MSNKLFMTTEDIVNLDLGPTQYKIYGIVMENLSNSIKNGKDILTGLANNVKIEYPEANAITNIKTMGTENTLYVYGDAVKLDEPAKLKLDFHW